MGASYPMYVLVCFTEESGSPFSVYETKFVELHEGVQYDKFDYSQKYRSEWPMNKKSKVSARYPCKVLRFSDSLLGLNALCKNLVDGSMTLKELEEERLVLNEKVKDNGVMKKLTKTKEDDTVDEVSDDDKKEVLRGKRKRTPSTKLKDSNFINSPLEKKNTAVSTKFVKRTATQKRKHSKEVGKKIIKELKRLEDDGEEKVVSSNSDANESNSSAEEDEIDDQDLLEQDMGIVPQSVTRKKNNKQSTTKKNMISSQSFESFTQLNRAGLSDSSQFSSTSAFGQLNVDENQEKDCSKCSNYESRIKKLQSDLSISYAENRTLQDQLTSCDAKQNELQELIRNYEVSRPTTKLGLDIQKLIEAHARWPVKMGNFKSSTDEYSDDTVGQQFSESWKPLKTVHVLEVDNLRQNPPLPALKKTIPPTAGLNVESVSNVETDPLTMHASENGSSGDNEEFSEEKRFPIPDSVLDLFSTKTLSNFVGKTLEYLHPGDDYLATRNLSDRNMSAEKIKAGNASDKIPMTEEEIQQVVVTVERKFKTTQKAQQLTEIRRAIVVKLNNSAAKAKKQQTIAK